MSGRAAPGRRIEDAALSSAPVAQIAVDLADRLRVANGAAEALFNLRPRDLGRPFQDLEVSYRPAELRSRIEQVRQELRPAELHDVEWQRPGGLDRSYYDVVIVPLFGAPGDLLGVSVSFTDVTRYRRVRDELGHANAELERAYEELQSLNARPARAGLPQAAPAKPDRAGPSGRFPTSLDRAVAFIEDHADRDLTVTDIAAASFVTVRAVQLAFRQHLGMTPVEYLRRVRLDRAHQDLVTADPACESVTAVASRWQFASPSRFAAYYRRTFGIVPSRTLRS